jgi:hypothetical protein
MYIDPAKCSTRERCRQLVQKKESAASLAPTLFPGFSLETAVSPVERKLKPGAMRRSTRSALPPSLCATQ